MSPKKILPKTPRVLVKVYDVVLTFDTNKPNEQIEEETNLLIERINKILAKEILEELPQIYKTKKIRIAIVPLKPEDMED